MPRRARGHRSGCASPSRSPAQRRSPATVSALAVPAWVRHLPIVRTYAALQARAAVLRDEVIKARTERDRARKVLSHVLDYGRMKKLVMQHAEAYRSADPFPHVVLDDLFDPDLLRQVLAEFEAMDRGAWHSTDRHEERKWATEDIQHF